MGWDGGSPAFIFTFDSLSLLGYNYKKKDYQKSFKAWGELLEKQITPEKVFENGI